MLKSLLTFLKWGAFRQVLLKGRDQFLGLFYSSECLICHSDLESEKNLPFVTSNESLEISLCSECRQAVVVKESQLCRYCGGSKYITKPFQPKCRSCRNKKFYFQKIVTIGKYDGELRKSILEMKRQTSGMFSAALARLLYSMRRYQFDEMNVDLILPVPMYRLRKMYRGVNSPELIAEELAFLMKVPVRLKTIRRIRATQMQSRLSPQERQLNIQNAFVINPGKKKELKGKRILLVDDILTTGSTCNEIARILLEANASVVFVAVLARAEGISHSQKDK